MSQSAESAVGEAGGSCWYSLARTGARPATIASIRLQSISHEGRKEPEDAMVVVGVLAIAFGGQQLAAGNPALIHAKEDAQQG